jgi:Flp pilus assembly CpaE family ATPase
VAAYLNRDPSRNVCTLAHAVRESPHAWGHALHQELQALHPRSPFGMLLCGLPKRELRASLTPAVMDQLIGELTRRFRHVILDVGAELLGMDAAAATHRTALSLAQHVLLVSGSDLVSLWHTRTALGQLERHLHIDQERISLVINRHDARYHHLPAEIEWHLGVAAAQVIPQDYAGLQRAVAEQYPVVLEPSSRAARAMLGLAERIHQGRVRLPALEAVRAPRTGWRAALPTALAGLLRWGGSSSA